jgi:hypothetical protein
VSYSKDVGEVSARYRSAGEVPSVTYPSGTHIVFTAPGSATSGQYGLFEWNMTGTPGGADPHFHKTFCESSRWPPRSGTTTRPVPRPAVADHIRSLNTPEPLGWAPASAPDVSAVGYTW